MNSTQPLPHREAPEGVIVPYRWLGKILKIPVFRLSLGDDLISRICIFIHNFFSRLCQGGSRSFRSFDPTIAQKSVDRFEALGARTQFITPRDGKGRVQMMTFQAADLERKIEALGASWERIDWDGRGVFAIVPPKDPTLEWVDFKEKISHFHWKEEGGMLITCDAADPIPRAGPPNCFLFAHSTSGSFASDWKRAGFYIGAKQDLCFFDNGNTWKNRDRAPSEESFDLEIEAVYNEVHQRYPIDRVWVGGSCGGAPVAAYLKRLLHNQGVNFFVEQSFPDLDDFVKPISPFFAPRVKGSLGDPSIQEKLDNPPPSCQFGAAKLWENLTRCEDPNRGKVVLVQVKEDEHISDEAYARYLDLARKVSSNVKHILYTSKAAWRHSDDFFRYEAPRRQFWEAVFTPHQG